MEKIWGCLKRMNDKECVMNLSWTIMGDVGSG